ncbi:MAG: L,D-transpeptidase family protein [Actinomycetota bacterium]
MEDPLVRASETEPAAPVSFTRRHLLGAAVAVAATGGVWAATRSSGSGPSDSAATGGVAGSDTPAQPPAEPAATPPPSAAATVESAPGESAPAAEPVAPLTRSLQYGLAGDDIQALQQRLADLPFDPGPVDGIYGGMTARAVWAFQKLVQGIPRTDADGVVSDDTWQLMNQPLRIAPRRTPGGTHLEVYLPEQVAVLFTDGEATNASHVSSGEGIEWCGEVLVDNDDGTTEVEGICGMSITPGGVYRFDRKVEGWRNAKLGRLYKPVYFNFGIAIHGATNVPNYPASRGCVRYPMHIAEYIQDMVSIGDVVYVFDGVEEPEVYGAQPMIFDYPDPDWVPPSTTTIPESTTTVPEATTTAPPTTTATTAPPTTTAPASSTTTTTTTSTTTTTTTSVPSDPLAPSSTTAPAVGAP